MLVLAGLGNPGAKYAAQRHNFGFMAADALATRWDFGPQRARFQGLAREGTIPTPAGPVRALVLKPQTFMNESGRSVGDALAFYKVGPASLVVFHDELDIAPGRFRMKLGGGMAGHNGLRSIGARLGSGLPPRAPGHRPSGPQGPGAELRPRRLPQGRAAVGGGALRRLRRRRAPAGGEGQDDKYQTEVSRLAPAEKLDSRSANRERLER